MRRPTTVDLMLWVTIVLWALNLTVTRYALTHGFKPLTYASLRYALAALGAAGIALLFTGGLSIGRAPRTVRLVALACVFLIANQFAFVYALKLTTATTVGLISGTIPIFAALISFLIGLERVSGRFWTAVLVTFAGVALVALGGHGDLSGSLGGDLVAIGLAASWAAYSVTLVPLVREHSQLRISGVVLLSIALPLLAASESQLRGQHYGAVGWLPWALLGFAVVGPLMLTNILWYRAVNHVGPARATLIANIQPFLGALFAYLILSEHIGGLQLAGGAAILAGIVLERRDRPPVVAAE